MGMYDTIYFDKQFVCPICQKNIDSIQVKEFENLLENYHIKDCVSHAEDIRIIKDELFCTKCLNHTGKKIYIVINRGILLGIAESLEEGKNILNQLSFEKLVLWYHDRYGINKKEIAKKNSYKKFLSDVVKWYGEEFNIDPPTGLAALTFSENESYLKNAKDPLESIENFLSYSKMKDVLDDLWNEGHEILDIYYAEDMTPGEENWYVDVYQDEINERCNSNWTWTVINRKALEQEGEEEEKMPEWEILVDGPFSDKVVIDAIKNWLNNRGYQFDVRMIQLEDAKGSGMIKTLRERLEKNDFVKYNLCIDQIDQIDEKEEKDVKDVKDEKEEKDVKDVKDEKEEKDVN